MFLICPEVFDIAKTPFVGTVSTCSGGPRENLRPLLSELVARLPLRSAFRFCVGHQQDRQLENFVSFDKFVSLDKSCYRDGRILTNHRQADGQRAPRRDGTASWTHFSEYLGHYHTWCGSVSDKSEQKWFKIGGTLGGTRIWPGLFLGPDSTISTVSPRNNQIHKFKEYFRWAVFSCGSFWCLWKSPIFLFCWVTDTNLDLFAFFFFSFFRWTG